MSKSPIVCYPPILTPCCMGPALPEQNVDLKGYFQDYRMKTISQFYVSLYLVKYFIGK